MSTPAAHTSIDDRASVAAPVNSSGAMKRMVAMKLVSLSLVPSSSALSRSMPFQEE